MAIKEGSHTLDPSLIRNGSVRINRIAHREGAMQAQRWRRRIGSNVARSYLRPSMTGSRLVKALDEVGGEVDQVLRRRCFERSGGFSTFPKACGERAGLVEKVCDGAANYPRLTILHGCETYSVLTWGVQVPRVGALECSSDMPE